MPELPDRPNLDQLRRQARELLRAATHNEPSAVARLGVVSGRITLSAAQLALAREYGYRNWPALKVEVERRRLSQPAGKSPSGDDEQVLVGVPGKRWSFGGAARITTSAGVPCFPKRWSSAPVTPCCTRLSCQAPARPPGGRPPRWGRHRECRSLAGPGAGG